MAAAAVLAGARSFTAIGEGIADVPQRVLAVLGARFDARRDHYLTPEESTVRRLTQQVDSDLLDAAISAWLTHHITGQAPDQTDDQPDLITDHSTSGHLTAATAVAVDGKSLRGTFTRAGGAGVHLLAAISHTTGEDRTDGIVLGQRAWGRTRRSHWFSA